MKPVIGIIGGTGNIGNWFKTKFEEGGISVLVASRSTNLSLRELAEKSDIVVVSVPLNSIKKVLDEIIPFLKKDSLITDFSSIKEDFVEMTFKNTSDDIGVLGMHPLFGHLEKDFKGQKIVFCRKRDNQWVRYLEEFFEKNGTEIVEMSAKEHDRQMAVIQALNSFVNISLAKTLHELELDEKLFTPAFKMELDLVKRMLSQSPDLYPNIQIKNANFLEILEKFENSVCSFKKYVLDKDLENYVREINLLK